MKKQFFKRKFRSLFNTLCMLLKTAYIEIVYGNSVVMVNATSYPSNNDGLLPKYKGNIGDDLNFWLLAKISKKKVVHYRYSVIGKYILKRIHYLFIGSVITGLSNAKSVILGAGVSPDQTPVPMSRPLQVVCVRGPLSRKYLMERRIACPAVYGDPALLLPCVLPPLSQLGISIR